MAYMAQISLNLSANPNLPSPRNLVRTSVPPQYTIQPTQFQFQNFHSPRPRLTSQFLSSYMPSVPIFGRVYPPSQGTPVGAPHFHYPYYQSATFPSTYHTRTIRISPSLYHQIPYILIPLPFPDIHVTS